MKISLAILVATLLLGSCGIPEEKNVSVSDVQISGFLKEYVKVVADEYKFTNNGDDAFITVQFELENKPNSNVCRHKHPENIRLNPIGKGQSIIDLGTYGFEPSRSEMGKLKSLLNSGTVGDKVRVSFEWTYFGISDDEGKLIFNEAESFEILDNTLNFCNDLSNDDLHWDDGYVSSSKTSTNTKKTKVSANNNWDKTLDSYEEYVDQYIILLNKVENGDNSAMTEYPKMMEKATDLSEKLNNAGDDLTNKQMKRFLELQNKFSTALQNMN